MAESDFVSDPYEGDPAEWGTPAGRAMIELLWNPPAPGSRGPKQRLSLDQIISAAMEIAEKDGVEKLSMRALASRLGVGAMTIYTYVPGRDELFELMIDRAWSTRQAADPSLPWRRQIEAHAREAWAMYERFPWLIQSNLWRMPLGPNVLDIQEDLYRAASLTGLEPFDVARITSLVEAHVFGYARSKITDTSVSASTGVSADEYWDSRSSFWGTYYSRERFPTMTHLWEQKAFDRGPEDNFEFGLALLLDGVELLISRHEKR